MADRDTGIFSGIKGFFAPEPDARAATSAALAVDDGTTIDGGRSDADWRAELSPDQYRVLRQHGTERPGTSPLNAEKRAGVFDCAGCGTPVYTSETKYDSHSGWPSFFAPIPGAVDDGRPHARHDPDRGALRDVRRPSRSCFRRRPAPDRAAPLHQRRRAQV